MIRFLSRLYWIYFNKMKIDLKKTLYEDQSKWLMIMYDDHNLVIPLSKVEFHPYDYEFRIYLPNEILVYERYGKCWKKGSPDIFGYIVLEN